MNVLYYESHVTIEPVASVDRAVKLEALCQACGFKVAKLLMQTGEPSRKDTFCSSRSDDIVDISHRMLDLVDTLRDRDFKVFRYKIEAVITDVRL